MYSCSSGFSTRAKRAGVPAHNSPDLTRLRGVTTAPSPQPWLFVTDAPSRVLCFDTSFTPPKTVSEVHTNDTDPTRADEFGTGDTEVVQHGDIKVEEYGRSSHCGQRIVLAEPALF